MLSFSSSRSSLCIGKPVLRKFDDLQRICFRRLHEREGFVMMRLGRLGASAVLALTSMGCAARFSTQALHAKTRALSRP